MKIRSMTPADHTKHPDLSRRQFGLTAMLSPWLASLGMPLLLTGCPWDEQASVPDVPFTQLDGSQHRLSELKGKVMLINFWATSCSSCVREMPQIVATYEKFKAAGFETLAVAMQYDAPAYVAAFAESRKLPFRVVLDHSGEVAKAFGQVEITPTTFLINKQGKIVKRYIGEPDFEALHTLVDELIKAQA